MAKTIFERYGGFATVSRIVSSFYSGVLDSPILEPYFEGVDMRRLIDHQTKFMASLMGGPASFTNEHLAHIHAHMGIDEKAWDELAVIFRESLEDHDMDETDIGAVMGQLTSKKPYVVVDA